jgi:hypothetical protein
MSDAKSSTSNAPMVRYAIVKPGYRVGDEGSVWSAVVGGCKPRVGDTWHQLKPYPTPKGYMYVTIGLNNRRYVHRLVLEAFVGPCPEGMECRHKDGDPGNNRLDNLCWGTPRENYEDAVRHGTDLKGEEQNGSVLTEADVLEAVAMSRAGERIVAIARRFEVTPPAIGKILSGENWRHVTNVAGLPPRRGRKGEAGGRAVLKDADVLEALAMHRAGKRTVDIARWFHVSEPAIRWILNGWNWGHVTGLARRPRRGDVAPREISRVST